MRTARSNGSVARRRRRTHELAVSGLMLMPFLLLFGVFWIFAILFSLGLSLTDWADITNPSFAGFANYRRLFANQSFQRAVLHTVWLWILVVPTLSLGALWVAWVLQSRLVRAKTFIRTLLFLPVLPSLVVVGVIFLLLLDPEYGLPNQLLRTLGLPAVNIGTDQAAAIPVLALTTIWRWFGYHVMIQLAGLQALPTEPLESARVDGAGAWATFRYVVLPMSMPVVLFSAVMSTIGVLNLFDVAYMLYGEQGGPAESGLTLGTLLFREAFASFDLGYASAIAYVLTAGALLASLLLLKVGNRGET